MRVLVADATRAKRELGWRPEFAALDTIVAHAWNWEGRRERAAAAHAVAGAVLD